jgi:hypothetical protein
MKRCPSCNRTFEVEAYSVCPVDATPLVSEMPASGSESSIISPSTQQRTSQQKYGGNKRKIFLIGGAALALILVVGFVLLLLPSVKSLGNYSGSLNDLFPEKVGDFKKGAIPPHLKPDGPPYLKPRNSYLANYTWDNKHCDVAVYALNFSSADEAKEGMGEIKRQEFSGTLSDGKPIFNITEGSKKNRLTTIGEKWEVRAHLPMGRQAQVIWTNGSVLFFLIHPPQRSEEDATQCERDIFDFEKNLAY